MKISKDKKEKMIKSIKTYFLNERDEDLGDLAAELILDFITKELAPEFYNQGIQDAYCYVKDKAEDMLELEKYN